MAAPGVANWRSCLSVLRQLGARTVRLSFDADCRDNPAVARALLTAAEALSAEGFALELERWDGADGKGIDDLLAAGKAPEVVAGDEALSAIRAVAEAAGVETADDGAGLARLTEVLAEGGAAALFRDRDLLASLARMALDEPAEYAAARAMLRGAVRIRDLDKALEPIRRQLQAERPAPSPAPDSDAYSIQDGRLCRNVLTKDGPVVAPLSNFAARITEELVRDDGAESSRVLALEGELASGRMLPRAEVPADQFPRMEWPTAAWGRKPSSMQGSGRAITSAAPCNCCPGP